MKACYLRSTLISETILTTDGTVNPIYGGESNPNVNLYTSTGLMPDETGTDPVNGTLAHVDLADPNARDRDPFYAFVPGEVWFNATTVDIELPVEGQQPLAGYVAVKLDLGADTAAYAIFSPELNAYMQMADFGGYDVMQISFRLNALNNGYEQLFIMGGEFGQVPEPTTLLLLGLGLVGLAGARRKFQI